MTELTNLIKQIEQLSEQSRERLADYVKFLRWHEAQGHSPETSGWSFSFIEAFKEASVQASEDPAGMDVNMEPARVGGVSRPALWAHPPVTGQAIIEYHVPIPQQVSRIRLRLAIGIRDGAETNASNLVAFGVKVNGLRVWGEQTNRQSWQPVEIPLDVISGDIARVSFTTEALGNHQWTWAVWGNPELTGTISSQ